MRKRVTAWALCLMLILNLCPGGAMAKEEPAPTVRILLTQLQLTDRADLETGTEYLAETGNGGRIRFPAGSKITLQVRDGQICLFYAGMSMMTGTALKLSRRGNADAFSGMKILPGIGIYPGDLTLTVTGGQLRPILSLSAEHYLLGVVPYEMSDSFPLEALKAQAVCARTYVLTHLNPKKEYDLTDNTNDQVFRAIRVEDEHARQAVEETAGLVVTSGGKLMTCYYSASNGGQTELPEHVWPNPEPNGKYAMTEDPYDTENPESPRRRKKLARDGSELPETFGKLLYEKVMALPEMKDYLHAEEAFRVDGIEAVKLTTPRYEKPSRLMTKMEVTLRVSGKILLPAETPDPLTYEDEEGNPIVTAVPAAAATPKRSDFIPAGTFTVTLDVFPDVIGALGLSIYGANNEILEVEETEEAFTVISGRYGHGVGMSQRGAQQMAAQYGKTFRDILDFYYPGHELMQAASGLPAVPTMEPVLAETPGPAATPTPRPTLMPVNTADLPKDAWVASVEGIADDSSLNLRAEPIQSSEVLRRLYKHQLLIVLETCEDPAWVRVKTDDMEGYVMVSFLEKVP